MRLFWFKGRQARIASARNDVNQLAWRLGVSRLSVSDLLHEKRVMTPEMAARVAKLLNTTPDSWLRMKQAVDLWEVAQKPEKPDGIKPIDKHLLAA